MKNINQLSENTQYIINQVINQLGSDDRLNDIREHGASGGYNGFIYYRETNKFFDDNISEIIQFVLDEYEFEYLINDIKRTVDTKYFNIRLFYDLFNNNHEIKYEVEIEMVKNYFSWLVLELVADIYCELE